MKILIAGWYYMIYPVVTAKEYFEILGYEVYFLPLLHYNQKFNGDKLFKSLNSFIKNIDPNIILWWNWECSEDILHKIKENNQNILHCLFNWDHPFCLSEWDNKHNRKITQKNIWDIVFVTGDCKLSEYLDSGSKEAYYLRMFADDQIHFPEGDKEYECDISFVLTNLYEDKSMFSDQIFDRKTFLENIIKEKDIKLKIYGPIHLKNNFPDHYSGEVHFLNNHKVFYNSKINLCTHVTNGNKYLNERVGTVLSSGGILLCDKVDNIDSILTDKKDYILIDQNNYIEQIKNILANYNEYKHIKENAVITAKKKFSPRFWSKYIDQKINNFIQNNPSKGINLNPTYSFNNYQKEKVSIVMTYLNRLTQIEHTLNTIEESKYPKNLIEVICFDDGSDIEPLIIDTSIYSFNIKIIHSNYDKDKEIINPTYSYNQAFKYITGEYIIIQNSECMHIGDIISYASQNLKKNNKLVISFPCWATPNEETSQEIFDNRFDRDKLKNIIESKWNLLVDYPPELKGWYNERFLRPDCLHFCNSFHIDTFKNLIGLFNTKLERILGFDDNEFAERMLFRKGLEIDIPEHDFKFFTVHQYHGKYNKPRPNDLFLKSYNQYRKINNISKNDFLKNTSMIASKTINQDYLNINKEDFFKNLKNKWCDCFVYLTLDNNQEVDVLFLRKCLKYSNFRIIYNQ
tara:strand:+ start:488 stop:2545 length:2058 start_codon:yes stop_codon:yes gene_type:complete